MQFRLDIRVSLIIGMMMGSVLIGNLQAQYTPERSRNIELYKSLGLDTCFVYDAGDTNDLTLKEIIVYDTNGNHILIIDLLNETRTVFHYSATNKPDAEYFYTRHGERALALSFYDTFIYDADDRLIQKRNIDIIGINPQMSSYELSYRNDTIVKRTTYIKGKKAKVSKYSYDNSRHLKIESTVDDSKVRKTILYSYDDSGFLTNYLVLNEQGDTTLTYEFILDSGGKKSFLNAYGRKGELNHQYKYQYNKYGLLHVEEHFPGMKNGEASAEKYSKEIFKYAFRKPKI